jgi:hypothetical protein
MIVLKRFAQYNLVFARRIIGHCVKWIVVHAHGTQQHLRMGVRVTHVRAWVPEDMMMVKPPTVAAESPLRDIVEFVNGIFWERTRLSAHRLTCTIDPNVCNTHLPKVCVCENKI